MELPVTINLIDITVGSYLELTRTGRPRLNRLGKLGRPVMALVRAATLFVAFSAARAAAADIGPLAPPGVAAKEFPSPQRPVARIVSPRRSAEELRDALNEAGQIVGRLELKPGMTVGDIGAGSGYHTVRLSHLVGAAGSVVAQDVTRDYLIELAKRTELLKLTNVKFALGEPHDPRLPASSLDAAILVHMYHEIAQPYAFLYNLIPALKRGARVGIVDLELPTSKHGTPIELLRCELEDHLLATTRSRLTFHDHFARLPIVDALCTWRRRCNGKLVVR